MKILIVDDIELNRDLMALMLRTLGEIYFADNGAIAVKAVEEAFLQDSYFDLICMDIHMPIMDGLKALHVIRELEQRHGSHRATIFMVTSDSSPEQMLSALENEGCDDFVVKPVIQATFYSQLRKHGLLAQ